MSSGRSNGVECHLTLVSTRRDASQIATTSATTNTVELEVEGQVSGKPVAPDRHEQDDRKDEPYEAVPTE